MHYWRAPYAWEEVGGGGLLLGRTMIKVALQELQTLVEDG